MDSPTRSLVQVEDPGDVSEEAGLDTEAIEVPEEPSSGAGPRPRRRRRLLRRVVTRAGFGVWFGLFLVAGGFGLIAYTWSRTAALIDVSQQIPYLVSSGLTALGLLLVGLMVVNLSVKRREAQERGRQLEEVRDALVSLRHAIEGTDPEEGDRA